jgi:putative glutamine amidotransferase
VGKMRIVAISGSKLPYLITKFILSMYDIKTFLVTKNNYKYLNFEGLILLGGEDISPKLYNMPKSKFTKNINYERDLIELFLIKKALKKNIPILGICRGMQLINIYFGGTLYQDLFSLNIKHFNTNFPTKTIKIVKNSALYNILKKTKIKVNSIHHQAINKLGKNLKISAFDKNNIPYAIESSSYKFLLGLQWHPEYIAYTDSSKKIFNAFAKAVKSL